MEVADVLDAIEASGMEQIEAIRKEAEEEADAILNAAKEEAEEIKQKVRDDLLRSAKREREKRLHETNLKQLQIEESARGQIIEEFLEQTRERLRNFRSDERYPDALQRLTEEALKSLSPSLNGNEPINLESDSRDAAQIKKILKELSYEIKSREDGKSWGGVTASSGDGRVKVVNTLQARMERASPYLWKSFSIRLKENG